jgi:hypothetical protein
VGIWIGLVSYFKWSGEQQWTEKLF